MFKILTFFSRLFSIWLNAIFIVLAGCSVVNEELSECKKETSLQIGFIFDYNMNFKDEFSENVHCLGLYIFDEEGKYVDSFYENDNTEISKGNFKVNFFINPGYYRIVAYGGQTCQESSFYPLFNTEDNPDFGSMKVNLNKDIYYEENIISGDEGETLKEGKKLHDHFYGFHEFEIMDDTDNTSEIISLIRNTNNIQINLSYNGTKSIDASRYNFSIIDDNNSLNEKNEVELTGNIIYYPYQKTTVIENSLEPGYQYSVAQAEFSVSRLIVSNDPVLIINNISNQKLILKVKLIDLMWLLKENQFSDMAFQEYLDRENDWRFEFFLDDEDDSWSTDRIIINDWELRLNDIDSF